MVTCDLPSIDGTLGDPSTHQDASKRRRLVEADSGSGGHEAPGFVRQLDSVAIVASPSPHIVMAEDDEDDYGLFIEVLAKFFPAIRVTRFRDGVEVTDYLLAGDRKAPSVILMDLNMPRRDGREAIEIIRSSDRLEGVPVVALTTSASRADEAHVLSHPRTAFVTKPMSYAAYVEFVRALGSRLLEGPPAGSGA